VRRYGSDGAYRPFTTPAARNLAQRDSNEEEFMKSLRRQFDHEYGTYRALRVLGVDGKIDERNRFD
jgi:hypothetical protein